ncbi:MAG: hypothetical protein HY017_18770 [Betaproteobacteria bacterium]|nr:hypothetical protein [Betaproteobacteria bacterium]
MLSDRRSEVYLPAAYLLCHALELGLKAYLLHAGAAERLLREYGHDLEACLVAVENNGLRRHIALTTEERDDLKLINDHYERKE